MITQIYTQLSYFTYSHSDSTIIALLNVYYLYLAILQDS